MSLFYTRINGRLLILLVYVDDILIIGENQDDVQQAIKNLQHNFDLKTLGLVNYFLGFECKTRENSNSLKNGKIVISVKIRNFSRSRMTKRTSPLKSSREI